MVVVRTIDQFGWNSFFIGFELWGWQSKAIFCTVSKLLSIIVPSCKICTFALPNFVYYIISLQWIDRRVFGYSIWTIWSCRSPFTLIIKTSLELRSNFENNTDDSSLLFPGLDLLVALVRGYMHVNWWWRPVVVYWDEKWNRARKKCAEGWEK